MKTINFFLIALFLMASFIEASQNTGAPHTLTAPVVGLLYQKAYLNPSLSPKINNQRNMAIALNSFRGIHPDREAIQCGVESGLKGQLYSIITQDNILTRIVQKDPEIFKNNRWVIKRCGNYCLLIPSHFCQDQPTDYQADLEPDTYTALEVDLGLKVNHLKTIDPDYFKSSLPVSAHKLISYGKDAFRSGLAFYQFNHIHSNLVNVLKDIFVTSSTNELSSANKTEWVIGISGHGGGPLVAKTSFTAVIADFTQSEFKDMMYFFSRSLRVKLILVESCSIGKNIAHTVFTSKNLDTIIQQEYPFDIIFEAIGDEPTYVNCEKNLIGDFMKKLRNQKGVPDYFFLLRETLVPKDSQNPVPQIRYKNTNYFLPLSSIHSQNKDTLIITEVMAATRKKPLALSNLVKNIVLYSATVPFELTYKHRIDQWYYKLKPSKNIVQAFTEVPVVHFKFLEGSMRSLWHEWPQIQKGTVGVYIDAVNLNESISVARKIRDNLIETVDGARDILLKEQILNDGPDKILYELAMNLTGVIVAADYIKGTLTLFDQRRYLIEFFQDSLNITPLHDNPVGKPDYILEFERTYAKIPEFPKQHDALNGRIDTMHD